MITCRFISSCGKRTAWKTWQNYLQLTESLVKLCNNPTTDVIESKMNTTERFFCLMYHAASTKYEVNKGGRQLENLPHTQDSLKQHVLRAVN